MKTPIISILIGCSLAAVAASGNEHRSEYWSKALRQLTRIVRGEPVAPDEFSYQIFLRGLGLRTCGGSLVIVGNTQLVLTAAHCVATNVPEDITLVAGNDDRSEQQRRVVKIIIHENFNKDIYYDDIALLVPNFDFLLDQYVRPIKLPSQGKKTTGNVEARQEGYGELVKVTIPIMDVDDCRSAYNEATQDLKYVASSLICAGDVNNGGRDPCPGNSGDPIRAADGKYLAGIVSYGEKCAKPGFSCLYTEVSQFINWIKENEAKLDSTLEPPPNTTLKPSPNTTLKPAPKPTEIPTVRPKPVKKPIFPICKLLRHIFPSKCFPPCCVKHFDDQSH